MNAKRFNNLIIIFLLILNCVLLALNYAEKSKYKITSRQEEAIVTVLRQNNVELNAPIIKEFNPLRPMELSFYSYQSNTAAMAEILFGTMDGITEEFGRIILGNDDKVLSFEKNGFLFENSQGTGSIDFNPETAKEKCDELVEKFNTLNAGLNLKFDYMQPLRDGYYTFEYRTVYDSLTVYSSYLRIRVSQNGIIQVRGNFFIPNVFNAEREIFSPDEALYSLMQELRNIYGADNDEIIKINKMDIVYRVDDASADSSASLKAEPYYRFYISTRNEPFTINAYTNVVK